MHGQIHCGETNKSSLGMFRPHLSVLLLMSESITHRAEAANQRAQRVRALELGAFKQGSSLPKDGIDTGSQLPALSP